MTTIWKAEPEVVDLSDQYDLLIGEMTDLVWDDLNEEDPSFWRTADAMRTVVGKVGPDLYDINERAEEWARENAGKLVTHLTAEKRDLVRRTTARALQRGYSTDEMAEILQHSIGLTPQWLEAVDNYRDGLIAKGLPSGDARRKAVAYAQQLRKARARSIAATELQAALNTGQRLLWEEWVEDGLLPRGLRRSYVVHKDERQCARCRPLSGLTAPLGEPWRIGGVEYLSPPIHPQCRCSEVLVSPNGQVIKHAVHNQKSHGRRFSLGVERLVSLVRDADDARPFFDDDSAGIADAHDLDTVRSEDVAAAKVELTRISQEWAKKNLPERVPVYRGGKAYGEVVAVSTDKNVARRHKGYKRSEDWFEGEIDRDDILFAAAAFPGDWNEGELLIRNAGIVKHGTKGKPGYFLLHPSHAPKGWTPGPADYAAANKYKTPGKAGYATKLPAKKGALKGAIKPKKMPPHSGVPKKATKAKLPASKKGGQKYVNPAVKIGALLDDPGLLHLSSLPVNPGIKPGLPKFFREKMAGKEKIYADLPGEVRLLMLAYWNGKINKAELFHALDQKEQTQVSPFFLPDKPKITLVTPELSEVEGQLFSGFEAKQLGPNRTFGGETFHLPPGGDGEAFDALDAQTQLVVKKYAQGKFGKIGFFGPDVSQDLIDNYYKAIGGEDAPDNYEPPTPLKLAREFPYDEHPSDVEILRVVAEYNKSHKNISLDLKKEKWDWGTKKGQPVWMLRVYGDEKNANDLDSYAYNDLPDKYQANIENDDVYDALDVADKGLILQTIDGTLDPSDAMEAAYNMSDMMEATGWEEPEAEEEAPDYGEGGYYGDSDDEEEVSTADWGPTHQTAPERADEPTELPQPKWRPITARNLDDEDLSTQAISPGEKLTGFNADVREENYPAAKHLGLLSYDDEALQEPSDGAKKNAKRAINENITLRLMGRLEEDEQFQEWVRYSLDKYINYKPVSQYDLEEGRYTTKYYKFDSPWTAELDKDYFYASGKNPDEASNEEKLLSVYANHAVKGWAETSGDSTAAAIAMQRVAQEHFGLPNTDVDMEHMKTGHTPAAWDSSDEIIKNHQPFMEAFLDSVYDETQSRLANEGIEEFELYRGMKISGDESELSPADLNIITNEEREEVQEEIARLQKKISEIYSKYVNGYIEYDQYVLSSKPLQEQQEVLVGKIKPQYEKYRQSRVRMQPLSSFSVSSSEATNFGTIILSVKVPRRRVFSTARTGLGCLNEFEFVLLSGPTTAQINYSSYIRGQGY